jgi:hypothetical protein
VAKKRRMGTFGSIAAGGRLAATTFFFALPFILLFGVVSGVVGYQATRIYDQFKTMDSVENWMTGFVILSIVLTLYSLLQLRIRKSASRTSWLPSLFLIPSLLMAGALAAINYGIDAQGGIAPLFITMPWYAVNVIIHTFVGGWLAVIVVKLADSAHRGEAMNLGDAVTTATTRILDIAGAHGAKVQAVFVGMQVLIPGIFYALQYAFVDHVAVLTPEEAALKRSGELTWGVRGRLFRVLTLWFISAQAAGFGIIYAMEGQEALKASLLDLRAVGLSTNVAVETVWALLSWLCLMVFQAVYYERMDRMERIAAAKAKKKGVISETLPDA